MDSAIYHNELSIKNSIDELKRVTLFLEEIEQEKIIASNLLFSLNLVMEEALSNTILYGYKDELLHLIKILFVKSGEELVITIIDDGFEYDPTLKADPDITLSAQEREIGGLGIFLVKTIMDSVTYKRREGKNYLIMTKKSDNEDRVQNR